LDIDILELLDSFSRQVDVVAIDSRKLVVKEYGSERGLVKWFIVNLSAIPIGVYPFALNPVNRMEREVGFLRGHTRGFLKPELYVVDYVGKRIVRSYVEGEKLSYHSKPEVFSEFGRSLSELHCSGWALGDTKISNFIYNGKGVYIVDAEQSLKTDSIEHYAWDLVVFLSTLGISCYSNCAINPYFYEERVEGFLKGYLESPCSRVSDAVGAVRNGNTRILLYLLVPFPLNTKAIKLLESHN